jgi:hypothetical protein
VVRVVRWRCSSLVLTSARLVELWGVGSRHQAQTLLSEIVSVTVVQSLLRRILGSGRLELELVGEDGVRWIDDVRKPTILQRVISRRLRPFGTDGVPPEDVPH